MKRQGMGANERQRTSSPAINETYGSGNDCVDERVRMNVGVCLEEEEREVSGKYEIFWVVGRGQNAGGGLWGTVGSLRSAAPRLC